jgi:ribonuclease PH
LFIQQPENTTGDIQQFDITELAGLRLDGRRFDQVRPMKHKIGVLPYADGSAHLIQGLNNVLVTIAGPHEPKKRSTDSVSEKVGLFWVCIWFVDV